MSDTRIFYKSLDSGQKLSANFSVREFACKDGSNIIPVDMELVRVLQDVRDHFKVPVTINSAYRTPSYNKKVGGVNASQHIRGRAADISVKGVSPAKVHAYLTEKYPNKCGMSNVMFHLVLIASKPLKTGRNRAFLHRKLPQIHVPF